MRKVTKYLLVFFLFFIISLPISHLMVFYVKQKMLEHEIEESMAYLEKEMPSTEKEFEKMFNEIDKSHDLDINSGGQMREYAERKSCSSSFYYSLEYERFVTSLPKKSLHYAILDYYGKQGLRVYLILLSIPPLTSCGNDFKFENKDNYIDRLSDYANRWKIETGNESKDWWDEFEKSRIYEDFLNDVFTEMETRYNMTLDEAYQKMMSVNEESENRLKNYEMQNFLIPFHKRIAEMAYHRYQEDKEMGDYITASFDSKMVFGTFGNYESFRNAEISFVINCLRYLKISNIYLDLILVVDFAVIMALVFLILYEKWEKRQAPTARFI